jgi:cellulose synthase/poly-beta-1,6-N-acetylglucosamine synthase-like glycosyltransferase
MLRRLLNAVAQQETGGRFTYSIVVADNDGEQSARMVVDDFMRSSRIQVVYCAEPQQNIALARNQAINSAHGDFIAFADDDEFPSAEWLLNMLDACERYQAAGVLGPVRPHFDERPPSWIIEGRFCERPEHPTGRVMDWEECRTGNVLFRRRILDETSPAFNPEFSNGGEDKDFFMRMTGLGYVFRWCNEATVYETVPPSRWRRSYMLKRAMLRGRNILKHPVRRSRRLATSVVAVPIYSVILLPTLLFGQQCFMKYCIKLCDHLGRLLAVVGINPVRDR